jgi:3'(2'), 5'-bisphosphate nucleotidase
VTQEPEIVGVELLDSLTLIASRAAAAILSVPSPTLGRREKADLTPVTTADEVSEAVILDGLARIAPGVPVVSEESTGRIAPAGLGHRFFLVDPLDGTREFLAGRDEFAVSLALVNDAVPIVGVIAVPARGLIWRGIVGRGAERVALAPGAAPDAASERMAIHTRPAPATGSRVVLSRSHLDAGTKAYVDRLPNAQRLQCGSALKFCLIAEGSADLYPRLSPTSEWDVAGGHALLLAAGGNVTRPDGQPLTYGQKDLLIPAFVAFGDPAVLPR